MAKMLASQTLALVICPALEKLSLWSPSAEELVLGTAIVESGLTYLKQHGDGPALGLWQVEPATHDEPLYQLPELQAGAWHQADGAASAKLADGRESRYQSHVWSSGLPTMLLQEA